MTIPFDLKIESLTMALGQFVSEYYRSGKPKQFVAGFGHPRNIIEAKAIRERYAELLMQSGIECGATDWDMAEEKTVQNTLRSFPGIKLDEVLDLLAEARSIATRQPSEQNSSYIEFPNPLEPKVRRGEIIHASIVYG